MNPSFGTLKPTNDDEFKPWRCADKYQYVPLEKGDNDEHWKTVVDHLMERKNERCEAWKDEVDKLLVFAGLFSAVVTGFVIDSYKSLSEDPIEALLTQLVAQGANQTIAATAGSGGSAGFSASESNKRVNALWFLSLVLSIATAIFGIVAQQWLREHMRTSPHNTPILQLPAQLHMQDEALDRFLVPQLFTLLPLLLVISLVLFLIGLVDFLWALNHQVAIPMSAGVLFIFAFILTTTMYPAFQSLPCQIPGSRKSPTPRVPCPYKSPQSWVFYTFTLIFKEWMFFLAWAVTKGLAHITSVEVIADFLDIPWRPLSDGWVSHAMLWLRQRDLDIIKFHMEEDLEALADDISSPTYGIVSPGLYDTVASLQATKATVSSSDNHKLACIFRCFQDVTTNPDQSLPPTIRHFYHLGIQYVLTETLITDDQLVTPRPLDVSPESTKQFMADNARLWFLVDDSLGVQVVTPHHLELLVRVLRWPVEHINTEFKSFKSGGFYRGPFPVWPLLLRASASSQIPENLRATLRIQLGRVLIEFFEEAARYCPPKDIIGHTLLTTSYLQGQLRTGYFLSSDVVGFENLKKIFLPKILESFSQMKSGGLEFLLVAVAIFMNEQYFSKDSFTRQERDTIFRVLHAHNKCCDQTYIRTLLESISQYDDREWPADFIDRHLNDSDHPRQITQPESAPDFEEKISADHVFVDFSESVDPDCQDIMVQRRSVGLIEENGQQCLMGPSNTRHAWRVHPVSLRHEENSKGHLWDVSL